MSSLLRRVEKLRMGDLKDNGTAGLCGRHQTGEGEERSLGGSRKADVFFSRGPFGYHT